MTEATTDYERLMKILKEKKKEVLAELGEKEIENK